MSAPVIGGVVLLLCSSSSAAAALMMGGDDTKSPGPGPRSPGPSAPPAPTPKVQDTPETMRSASTVWSGEAIGTGHGRGRLDSPQGWSAQTNAIGEWYQIDNGVVGKITGIAIKGRNNSDQRITTFKVRSKGSDGVWKDVEGGKVYTGNSDQDTKVDVTFATPVDARYIRIYPETYNAHMSLRADIIVGKTRTDKTPTVVDVPYSGHSASTVWGGEAIGTGHGTGRLDSAQGWSAQNNTVGEWYQLDNGSATNISGVVIKGRKSSDQHVTSFKAQYKDSAGTWKDVDSGYVFEGSQRGESQANVYFKDPINTSAIRIYPQTWNAHMSLRAGLLTGGSSSEGYAFWKGRDEEITGFSF